MLIDYVGDGDWDGCDYSKADALQNADALDFS